MSANSRCDCKPPQPADPRKAVVGEDADESARWESGVTKGGGARGGFRWFALPGEGVGVGAVEVPELLDLADELAQRGHLPHRLAAGAASARRRRPPRRAPSLPHSLSSSSSGSDRGFRSTLAPLPPFPPASLNGPGRQRSGEGDGVSPRAVCVRALSSPCGCGLLLLAGVYR